MRIGMPPWSSRPLRTWNGWVLHPRSRRALLGDVVYSAAAAFTIAADPEPQVALLDMVVMTTLGRMVYEDYWRPRFGAPDRPWDRCV